jgi:hypothetical protein
MPAMIMMLRCEKTDQMKRRIRTEREAGRHHCGCRPFLINARTVPPRTMEDR